VNDPVRIKQWALLEPLLASALGSSAFQASRLPEGFQRPASLAAFLQDYPLTAKPELVADQTRHFPSGSNLPFPEPAYVRFSQTSGTTARPLAIWDTAESWDWLLANWVQGFQLAGVSPGMRAFFAFSFGPFLGFWTAFEAGLRMGLRCLPSGGLGTVARLHALLDQKIEVLCCTPTYALHLAATAAAQGLDLSCGAVRKIIVAGEPGGSLPEVRRQIQSAWPAAELLDHYGLTEVGPVAFSKTGSPGFLHVLEERYLAEVLHPDTHQPVSPGECGELVLTPLGRSAWPLFRYRTGDLVRPLQTDSGLVLEGGILGRVDDMVIVRGVNLYPGAVEDVVRSVLGLREYRVTLSGGAGLVQMELEIEAPQQPRSAAPASAPSVAPFEGGGSAAALSPVAAGAGFPLARHPAPAAPRPGPEAGQPAALRLEAAFERAFSLRIPVREVPHGSLPRFELKARRWVRRGATHA
jgi:phenylacetate-CoA ligase